MPRQKLDTVRTNIYLPVFQKQLLVILGRNRGVTTSEIVRRAVDDYLKAELGPDILNVEDETPEEASEQPL